MNITLFNPTPTDSRMEKWGDFHFGRSLTKYLERENFNVSTMYNGQWEQAPQSDVSLVLRGKYPHTFLPETTGLKIMWVISHPDDVSRDELAQFDLVYVASSTLAQEWQRFQEKPVKLLLQCTDPEEFRQPSQQVRRDIVFIGNTRGQSREVVIKAHAMGLKPKIWGRGWEQFPEAPPIVSEYIDNRELGALYGRSRLTLNDHWPDMIRHGFVNNRVFDALACGLPILSDANPGLDELKLPGVMTYNNDASFTDAVSRYWLQYPSLLQAAASARELVVEKYSFGQRAKTIAEDIAQLRN